MRDKILSTETGPVEHKPGPFPGIRTLETVFQKNGLYDEKLFYSDDKVTYTFVSGEEVVSLHFDKVKKTIFYKGHNIANLSLNLRQIHHLEQFRNALEKNPEAVVFAAPYSRTLNAWLKEHA